MTPSRWQRVQTVFHQVLAHPEPCRDAVLAVACGKDNDLRQQVCELVEVHAREDLLDRPAISPAFRPAPSADLSLQRIGRYQVLRLLGEGGMGRIYLAQRVDGEYRQRVALKLLHPGLESSRLLQRFSQERQILADLRHPNIAMLLDGGTTPQGQPYLVMEYVDGVTLDRYCRRQQPSLQDRLQLFLKICSAVEAAHRILVVHRDLKPENILVTAEGEPKLLDFGIAKLLRPEGARRFAATAGEERSPLTPEYASPEHCRGGNITTASDVYSLGAVLYCLLTGHSPHRLPRHVSSTWAEVICHQPIELPSSKLRRSATGGSPIRAANLAGDLDHIVLRALHKEPQKRYPSVERLALDLRAYLGGYPVEARDAGWLYNAGRWIRRHRVVVAVASLASVGLLVFLSLLLSQQQRLIEERDLARSTAELVQNLFSLPDPQRNNGNQLSARDLLDQQAAALEQPLTGPVSVRAALRSTLGVTYSNLGLYEQAAEQLQRAIDLRQQAGEVQSSAGISQLLDLAVVRHKQGRDRDAADLAGRALALSRRPGSEDAALEAKSLFRLAKAYQSTGDFKAAEDQLQLGLRRVQGSPVRAAREAWALGFSDLAYLQALRGRPLAVEAPMVRALAILQELHGERHPATLHALDSLAITIAEQDPEQALAMLHDVYERSVQLYGEEHPQLAKALNNLGGMYLIIGRPERSETLFEQALDLLAPSLKDDWVAASVLNNLADARCRLGKLEEAETLHRQALDMMRRNHGTPSFQVARSLNNLGAVLMNRNDFDGSESNLRRALKISEGLSDQNNFLSHRIRFNLERLERRRGQARDAVMRQQRALQEVVAELGPEHPRVAKATHALARAHRDAGDTERAEHNFRRAIALAVAIEEYPATELGRYRLDLATLLRRVGNSLEAARIASKVERFLQPHLSPDHALLCEVRRLLARCWIDLERREEAASVLQRHFAILLESRGWQDNATQGARRALVDLYEDWAAPQSEALDKPNET